MRKEWHVRFLTHGKVTDAIFQDESSARRYATMLGVHSEVYYKHDWDILLFQIVLAIMFLCSLVGLVPFLWDILTRLIATF